VRPPVADPTKIKRIVIEKVTSSEEDDAYEFAYMGNYTSLAKEVDAAPDPDSDDEEENEQ